MKRIKLWLVVLLATPLILFLLLCGIVYIPSVQNYMVQQSVSYASRLLGMQVSIKNVRIAFPLDLELNEFLAIQEKDTVMQVNRLQVDVPFLPLLEGRVYLDGFSMDGVRANTLQLIDAVQISGHLDHLALACRGIGLKQQQVAVQQLLLKDAQLHVLMRDSVPEKESAPVDWNVVLEKVDIQNTSLQLLMDTMDIRMQINDGHGKNVALDLGTSRYELEELILRRSALSLALDDKPASEGLDYSHIAFDSLTLHATSLVSQGTSFAVNVLDGSMRERSGLTFDLLKGSLAMDSLSCHVHDFRIQTPYSFIDLQADVDMDALQEKADKGKMDVDLTASFGKKDILQAVGPTLARELAAYPDADLKMKAIASGNMNVMDIRDTRLVLPGVMDMDIEGQMRNINDPIRRSGQMKLTAHGHDLTFLQPLVDIKGFTLPNGILAELTAEMNGSHYQAEGRLQEGRGDVKLAMQFNALNEDYRIGVRVDSLNLRHYLPKDSLGLFSAQLDAEGSKIDMYNPKALLKGNVILHGLQFGDNELRDVHLGLDLGHQHFIAMLQSDNEYLRLHGNLDARMKRDSVVARIALDARDINLYNLDIARDSMSWALKMRADVYTDMNHWISTKGAVTDMLVSTKKRQFTPKDVRLDCLLADDSISAHLETGDLYLDAKSSQGIDSLFITLDKMHELYAQQDKEHRLSLTDYQKMLPMLCLKLQVGHDNPLSNFFGFQGYAFHELAAHVDVSAQEGMDAHMHIYRLQSDSVMLDTIRLGIEQRDTTLLIDGQIRNNRRNPQFVFNSLISGRMLPDGAAVRLQLFDNNNVKSVDMGVYAQMVEEGWKFTLRPDTPYLAYQSFNLNPNASVLLHDGYWLDGEVNLLTDKGTGLKFKGGHDEEERHFMELNILGFNLGEAIRDIPYLPDISGFLNGRLLARQTPTGMKASGSIQFDNLTYEGSELGRTIELALNAVSDEGQPMRLMGAMRRNGKFIATLGGDYSPENDQINLKTKLHKFPLDMANGFIPDQVMGLRGAIAGNVEITGSLGKPVIEGELRTDSVYLYSDSYAVNMRVENRAVFIQKGRLNLSNLRLYSEKNDEMVANGSVDFSDLDRIRVDMSVRANDFLVIDEPRNPRTLVYGKAFINANATVRGLLDNLEVRGNISLLGKTNMTYVLKDSPLTVENRLSELVTFVDFSDTIQVMREKKHVELGGISATFNLDVADGAKVCCDLGNNRESYVDLVGGGNLILGYNQGKMTLRGRYTINVGEMKYTLPLIPLKTFSIGQGSYVEFVGDVMDPKLNLIATETTRAMVQRSGMGSRSVEFKVGVKITQTLSNMGLEFTIDAPSDIDVQNDLNMLTPDMKAKTAVAMLVTGAYMNEHNAQGLSMGAALSSFLQNEISNLAGTALRSVDLSVGVDNNQMDDGTVTTDYSFRFAKRLWGNRVSIIIGGKVSTGTSPTSANGAYIDNVSVEYRLDDSGTRYVRLFYANNWTFLEGGYVAETGVGVVFRKKMTRFGELFIFKDTKTRERRQRDWEQRRERREDAEEGEEMRRERRRLHRRQAEELEKAQTEVRMQEAVEERKQQGMNEENK